MRIEIPPELRDDLRRGGGSARVAHRKVKHTAPEAGAGLRSEPGQRVIDDPKFQQLFQSVYDGALLTSLKGDIIDANERAEEFFHCQRDQFANRSVLQLISGSDESLIETLRTNLASNRFTLIQAFCQRLDGSLFPSEISVNHLQLADNDYLCFFVRDITMRRQTEEMVRTVHNAIHNAGNGIVITDIDGRLEYVNPAVARLWQYPDDQELLRIRIQQLWADPEAMDQTIKLVLQGQSWSGELTARRYDGLPLPLQVSATANHDTDEQLAGMVFSFVDISDRKRAEEMSRQTERQRVMLESIGTACHHLGQPATILLASLGMMQKNEASIDTEMRNLLRQGIASAEQLQAILHRLNTINEYRTVAYLESETDRAELDSERILEL